ncbi:Cytochrome P450 1A1 [Orchesella cincta]|uniref:Cytochrome P450 1A1 n=1 Tax=Orchesella cincta TaxID=48709 RepID=A0A1D2M4B4_ORCCI|nr:Cytochrome P450 1A1 [Orchesella cincta]
MTEDTMFHGYLLPKDVTVISNLYAIHHDPKIWGEDFNEFRPERFLSEDKTRVVYHEALMPLVQDDVLALVRVWRGIQFFSLLQAFCKSLVWSRIQSTPFQQLK